MRALRIAIQKAGSASKLARRLRCSPQTVTNWCRRKVAVRACKRVVRVTADPRVTLHSLRPDTFPKGTT